MGSGTAEQASSPQTSKVTGWTGLARCFFPWLLTPGRRRPLSQTHDSSL